MNAVTSLRERVASVVRGIVAGDREPVPLIWDETDPGWFPLDHPVRTVHTDSAMFIGGIRALLLQSLHPAAMFAVSQHSSFRSDPLGRLQRTAEFLALTTFGAGSEADRAVEIVRAIHDRVEGEMPDGTPYSANDPHLLTWVHVTEVSSFLAMFQRYGSSSISATEADNYVAGMARVAEALGAETVPRNVAELDKTIDRYRPELMSTDWSREATRFLLAAPLPISAKPAYALMFSAALGSLPWWVRNELLLPVPPGFDPLLVRPATTAVTRVLQWALTVDRPTTN